MLRKLSKWCRENLFVLWCVGWLAVGAVVFTTCTLTVHVDSVSERAVADPITPVDAANAAEVYERRLSFHARGIVDLKTNLKWQGFFVVIALLLMGKGIRSGEVGGLILNERVFSTLLLVIPAVLLYLWIEFGYLYLDLIDNRVILAKLIEARESAAPHLNKMLSAQPLLSDHSLFLDFWMREFEIAVPSTSVIDDAGISKKILGLAKIVGFALFLGLVHACMLAPICESFLEQSNGTATPKRRVRTGAYLLYSFLIVCVLLTTHFEFYFVGHKPNWAEHVLLGTGIALTVVLVCTLPVKSWALPRED